MKVIYIDDDFKCYVNSYDGKLREVHTDFFDGKCDEFVEGYRFVPSGEIWTREDSTVFVGEMIAPWKDFNELDEAQREFELVKLAEYEAIINELYSEVTAE